MPIRVVFRLRVEGLDHVPASGGAIVAPTHRSNFDSVVVGVALQRHLRYMAKAELYRSRPFAWLLRSAGAFKVERGKSDIAAVEQAIQMARRGELVCIFPEGTRNRDGTGKPFSGAARMKVAAGVPMIPVAVSAPTGCACSRRGCRGSRARSARRCRTTTSASSRSAGRRAG